MTNSLPEEENLSCTWRPRLRFEHRVMRIEKDEAANSTNSQFCGINNDMQFAGENPKENLKEKANRHQSTAIPCSNGGIPCFGKTHSLFRAKTGNHPQRTVIAAQMGA
jgi:hypothetical protein